MGLRHVMGCHHEQVAELVTVSPVALVDLNSPGEYERALGL